MTERPDKYGMTVRIDLSLRKKLLQWGVDHDGTSYTHLVRSLLNDYFAGKRMARIGEVAK